MRARIWNRSISLRLTLWYSAFVAILLAAVFSAMLLSQQLSSRDYFQKRLSATALEAEGALALDASGALTLPDDLSDDVRVAVLDENGALLLGKNYFNYRPTRDRMWTKSRMKGGIWYIMDFPIERDGAKYWIRCYMSSASVSNTMRSLLTALIACVPLLVVMTLVGGILIAKRALRPLTQIAAIAESVSDSGDLDKRIQLDDPTTEISRLSNAFNRMFERLARSMEREKRFISDASHELRTPVSVVRAQSEFALAPDRSAEEKDAALRIIHERSERAGQMLNQMLMLSRMDAHRLPLRRERLDLSELTGGLCDELRDAAAARGMTLECSLIPDVYISGDELLLMRMLTNLVQNAIHYGNPGGHILVTLTAEAGRARLSVRDDGPGIPKADQARIWDRFYQADKSAPGRQGTGLGLPIVLWIVEAHGGSIHLESEPGQGSTFTVELPV